MTDIRPLRAAISRAALAENIRRALARADGPAVADLRRDACGHGAALVAAALAEAGVTAAVVDDTSRTAAEDAGLTPTADTPTLDGRTVYGLPHGEGRPVMRAAGSVLSTKRLLTGEGVSYNHTHIAARDTHVALVSGGFGQGVARAVGNRVTVEIGGALHPIIGRVAMDVCVIDIGDAQIAAGDEVVYFGGDGPAALALAEWEGACALTGAELVCAIGLRVAREDAA